MSSPESLLRLFDLAPGEGVEIAPAFSGAPDGKGVLLRRRLELPAFEVACYYAAGQKYDEQPPYPVPWPDGANRVQPLPVASLKGLKDGGLFLLLALEGGRHLALLPLASDRTLAWFASEGDGLSLLAGTLGTVPFSGDLPLLAWAADESPHRACARAWGAALRRLGGPARLRGEKAYGEPFRYLGWCSWEEYKEKIDEAVLTDAIRKIAEGPLPIRWVLVDDGHLDHDALQLKSFEPNEKFPRGFDPLLAFRRPGRIRWFGLWLNMNGYWTGVAPENRLGGLNESLRAVVVQHPFRSPAPRPALLPRNGPAHARAFYEAMIGSARRRGFDFVKVDNQARNLQMYLGTEEPAAAAAGNARALEEACERHDLPLINCMALGTLAVFGTRRSAVTRCSEDYVLRSAPRARRHLHNSYGNLMWLGPTVFGDHDMFHSCDPFAGRTMAVSKALSAGPVYLSDNPSDFRAEFIRPLVYEDGEILRPLAPAAPLPDSVYLDPFAGGRPYRVAAPLPGGAAAVAAYNLTEPERPVSGRVTIEDFRSALALAESEGPGFEPGARDAELGPPEGIVLYDAFASKALPLAEGGHGFSLPGFGDLLFLLCPVRRGWAAIGRADKYLAPAAALTLEAAPDRLVLRLVESGPLLVWSGRGAPFLEGRPLAPLGAGLYRADLETGARDRRVEIRRGGGGGAR